jgi:hypothetical protein
VAFEQDGGYVDADLTPELVNVQCEACHGPGKAHVESEGSSGSITARPDEATCRTCHTPGQDAHFDYPAKKALVHGR